MKRYSLFGGFRLSTLSVVMSLTIPSAVWAQDLTTSAFLTGIVTDASGAIVPRATVTVSGVDNGVTRTLKTDANGSYTFPLLPPATYSLKVELNGFQTYEQSGSPWCPTIRPNKTSI